MATELMEIFVKLKYFTSSLLISNVKDAKIAKGEKLLKPIFFFKFLGQTNEVRVYYCSALRNYL